ncbi:universal stress protein [Streptomyces albogriseolus]|uniref:universal stress protein n=1 Tax=Streptomyces albogriseolus TaxID=1887 RepID=UPI00345F5F1F
MRDDCGICDPGGDRRPRTTTHLIGELPPRRSRERRFDRHHYNVTCRRSPAVIRGVTAGIDGSPGSGVVAEWAALESLLRGVPLCLVHVHEGPRPAAADAVDAGAVRHQAEEFLADTARTVRRNHPSLRVSTRLLLGRAATALTGAAAGTGLLVLGSRGLSGTMDFLLGSVARETVSSTQTPVVLVRVTGQPAAPRQSAPDVPTRDVIVGLDIHHDCASLLDFGFAEAARRGDRLVALHGWSIWPVVRDAGALVAAQRDMGSDVARRLTRILAPWREKFPSVDVAELTPIGSAAHLLVHASDRADLVVVGRRVHPVAHGGRIGLVTHAVIQHSAVPVAVVAHH